MKTLENQTLLFDKDCPLCNAYTNAFIKVKMLDKNGRKAYSDVTQNEVNFIDLKRATDEIALIDTKNKTVIYGIDSLLKVVGHSLPFVETIGNIKPIKFCLKKLYAFISYNRKVIIPSKTDKNNAPQCVPTFNVKYRYMYILFATLITSIVLFKFSTIIPKIPESSFLRESTIALGQIIFQSLFLLKINSNKRLNYIGNLMTISLVGSLILIPILITHSIIQLPEIVLFAWFGLTVSFMLYEHIKRVKLLELPKYLSMTWVLYRIIVLYIILNF